MKRRMATEQRECGVQNEKRGVALVKGDLRAIAKAIQRQKSDGDSVLCSMVRKTTANQVEDDKQDERANESEQDVHLPGYARGCRADGCQSRLQHPPPSVWRKSPRFVN